MKILNKNNTVQNEVNQYEVEPNKVQLSELIKGKDGKLFSTVIATIILVGTLLAFWTPISRFFSNTIKNINYATSGWTTKTESKTYPISHIRIDDETDYYDENQLNAGYSLHNYKALKDKGDTIALNIIKTKALEGDNSNYPYAFIIDGVDYDSVDVTSDNEFFIRSDRNVFDKVEYQKGLDVPQVKVYYKLNYHYGKFDHKELQYETTLILPE